MQALRISVIVRHFSLWSKLNAQYGADFVSPVYRVENQKKLIETGDIEKFKHVPIKAAEDNVTSSVFHDVLLSKMTNYIMREGKKKLARQMLENALANIKLRQLQEYHSASTPEEKNAIITDPIRLFKMAVRNSRPVLKLKPVRRGGQTYQVPAPITDKESLFLGMRWIVNAAKDRDRSIKFSDQLAHEIYEAAYNRGRVVKEKIDLHKKCEANRAYAHYRWL